MNESMHTGWSSSKSDLYWPECEPQADWCRQPVSLSYLHQGTGSAGRLSLEPVTETQWRLCGSDAASAGSHNGPPVSTLWGQKTSHNKIRGGETVGGMGDIRLHWKYQHDNYQFQQLFQVGNRSFDNRIPVQLQCFEWQIILNVVIFKI
jgi:hypothetical protein